jgi:hypothetical protein
MRTALLLALVAVEACGQDPDPNNSAPEIKRVSEYNGDRARWEARAEAVRHGILAGAGLDPLPVRTPLNPIVQGRRFRAGYTVENVAFESLPGYFVTGNLYRPLGRDGKRAAILHPHGHFEEDGWTARTRPEMQARAAHLAQMGAVVLAYDMVGWGDSTQLDHDVDFALALQLWNSLRAVDFLVTLPEVDARRIGVTGASGGATQALLLAAVDERIAASAPVVMLSAAWPGGCGCESGMPIRDRPPTDNAEIAALFAPRPQMIVSDGNDWTVTVPDVEYPYLSSIYGLYGAAPQVSNVHLADEGHDYGIHKREAVYRFFAHQLGLQPVPLADPVDGLEPEGIAPEPDASLRVFDGQHPRPDDAIDDPESIAALLFGA